MIIKSEEVKDDSEPQSETVPIDLALQVELNETHKESEAVQGNKKCAPAQLLHGHRDSSHDQLPLVSSWFSSPRPDRLSRQNSKWRIKI